MRLKGTFEDWGEPSFSDPGPNQVRTVGSDEWLNVYFNKDIKLLVSLSFCYAAFDTADLNTKASSNKNRREPMPQFNDEIGQYQYTSVRRQLSLNGSGS